jgi:hypothetical protein
MEMTIIAVVKSRANGQWTYCPLDFVPLLKPEYDDEAPFETQYDAMRAVARDPSIPREASVIVMGDE